jgi:hypothetical protein
MDRHNVPDLHTGRYYGSDCVRYPLAVYRGPGEPRFESDGDWVDLAETAKQDCIRAVSTVRFLRTGDLEKSQSHELFIDYCRAQ